MVGVPGGFFGGADLGDDVELDGGVTGALAAAAAEAVVVADVVAAAAEATAPGAPVNPAATPIFSISSQRGQGPEAAPCRARSMTRRVIFSTTCSK